MTYKAVKNITGGTLITVGEEVNPDNFEKDEFERLVRLGAIEEVVVKKASAKPEAVETKPAEKPAKENK